MVKNPPVNAGDTGDVGSIPGQGRSPGEGNSNPLLFSCLENSMGRDAWQATVHRVTESLTQLSMHYSQAIRRDKVILHKAMISRGKSECQSLVLTPCLTLFDPMNCSPPGSSVHEMFQARILEWVVIPFSRGSSQPRDRTWASCIASRFFTL